MPVPLIPHPDFPSEAVGAISIDATRTANRLVLRYRLEGVSGSFVAPVTGTGRVDGLWKHTCFEAFVRGGDEVGYRELNAADGPWAAYRFDGYREGMATAEIGPPDLRFERSGDGALMTAIWRLDLPADGPWRIGVSAVIEAAGGRTSYWALRHPVGKPDFHHPDCFALELPEAGQP